MKLLFFLLAIGVFILNCISSSQRGYVKKKVTPPVESDSNTLILGKKIKTVPQVTIDGKLLGGYTEVERFLRSLH